MDNSTNAPAFREFSEFVDLIDLNEEGSFNVVDFDTYFRSIPAVNPSNVVVVVESSQPLVPKRPLFVGPSHFN
jgi:hypothetical protein